ncbi:hypothetical protein BT93_E1302 [Corymbia citriodora subsp. variegata]|nr:hypothetical protein BT93_E1302 [Corymbia citriodora subsp. variegata]
MEREGKARSWRGQAPAAVHFLSAAPHGSTAMLFRSPRWGFFTSISKQRMLSLSPQRGDHGFEVGQKFIHRSDFDRGSTQIDGSRILRTSTVPLSMIRMIVKISVNAEAHGDSVYCSTETLAGADILASNWRDLGHTIQITVQIFPMSNLSSQNYSL